MSKRPRKRVIWEITQYRVRPKICIWHFCPFCAFTYIIIPSWVIWFIFNSFEVNFQKKNWHSAQYIESTVPYILNFRQVQLYDLAIVLIHTPPSAAYMSQWIGAALVKIITCHLFGAKPLSKPMLFVANWILRHRLQWNFNQSANIFSHIYYICLLHAVTRYVKAHFL